MDVVLRLDILDKRLDISKKLAKKRKPVVQKQPYIRTPELFFLTNGNFEPIKKIGEYQSSWIVNSCFHLAPQDIVI